MTQTGRFAKACLGKAGLPGTFCIATFNREDASQENGRVGQGSLKGVGL